MQWTWLASWCWLIAGGPVYYQMNFSTETLEKPRNVAAVFIQERKRLLWPSFGSHAPSIISATFYSLYRIAQPSVGGDYGKGHGARIVGAILGSGFLCEIFMNFIHPIFRIIIEAYYAIGALRIRFTAPPCGDLEGALGQHRTRGGAVLGSTVTSTQGLQLVKTAFIPQAWEI